MKKVTNPKGYNQHKPDPRQALFLSKYLNPKSETFSNAYQSAIASGYDKGYAKQMTARGQTWMKENVRTDYIVRRAEKNLQEFIEPEFEDNKIKADMTKFSLSRLAKDRYSDRHEHTGTDGEEIQIVIKADGYRNTKHINHDATPDRSIEESNEIQSVDMASKSKKNNDSS